MFLRYFDISLGVFFHGARTLMDFDRNSRLSFSDVRIRATKSAVDLLARATRGAVFGQNKINESR